MGFHGSREFPPLITPAPASGEIKKGPPPIPKREKIPIPQKPEGYVFGPKIDAKNDPDAIEHIDATDEAIPIAVERPHDIDDVGDIQIIFDHLLDEGDDLIPIYEADTEAFDIAHTLVGRDMIRALEKTKAQERPHASIAPLVVNENAKLACVLQENAPVFLDIGHTLGEGNFGSVRIARVHDHPESQHVVKTARVSRNEARIRVMEAECEMSAALMAQVPEVIGVEAAVAFEADGTVGSDFKNAEEIVTMQPYAGKDFGKGVQTATESVISGIKNTCTEIGPTFCEAVASYEALDSASSELLTSLQSLQEAYKGSSDGDAKAKLLEQIKPQIEQYRGISAKRAEVYRHIEETAYDRALREGMVSKELERLVGAIQILEKIHTAGMVWNDLKPDNLTEGGPIDPGGLQREGNKIFNAPDARLVITPGYASGHLTRLDYSLIKDEKALQQGKTESPQHAAAIDGMRTYFEELAHDTRDDVHAAAVTLLEAGEMIGIPGFTLHEYVPGTVAETPNVPEKKQGFLQKGLRKLKGLAGRMMNKNNTPEEQSTQKNMQVDKKLDRLDRRFLYSYFQLHGIHAKAQGPEGQHTYPDEVIRALSTVENDAHIKDGQIGIFERIARKELETNEVRAQRPKLQELFGAVKQMFTRMSSTERAERAVTNVALQNPEAKAQLSRLFDRLYESNPRLLERIVDKKDQSVRVEYNNTLGRFEIRVYSS